MVTKTDQTVSTSQKKSKAKNPVRYLLLAALLLFLLWAGLKTYRLVTAVSGLLSLQTSAETMMAAGIGGIEAAEAQDLVLEARQHLKTIKQETAFLMPLTPYFGWLPEIGPLVTDALHLLEMADAGVDTGAYLLRGTAPILTIMQNEGEQSPEKVPAIIAVLADAQPDIAEAGNAFTRYQAARSQLTRTAEYPQRLQDLLNKADSYTPLAADGLKFAQVMPQIMGHNGRRHYLLIAQNEDELRATGGFFSGVGLLAVENGRIADLTFEDASLIQDWANKPYDFPPQPLYEFMKSELFLFRDANFWPDFPTSAEVGLGLYEYTVDESPPLDGLIAIDQTFMQLLLQATGPVQVPGSDITLNHKTIIDSMRASWNATEDESNSEWFHTRKDFMGIFAAGVRHRLEAEFDQIDPIYLAQVMDEAIKGKHIQLYMRDPAELAILDEIGWDGRMENKANQDYLFVVDTNMGFNKSNLFVERSLDYQINLQPDNTGEALITVNYTHTQPDNGELCSQDVFADYRTAAEYTTIAHKCYYNYLRVYAPAGSQLLDASTHFAGADLLLGTEDWPGTAVTPNEFANFTTFANFIVLPRGQQLSSYFHYQLPPHIVTAADDVNIYRLLIPKQAGTDQDTVRITVNLPPGSTLVAAQPSPTAVTNNQIIFEDQLDTDLEIELRYQ